MTSKVKRDSITSLRERKKRRTGRHILDTAARLFAANTYEGTTMEEVAAAAEVSVGTLYNYFGSKPSLLLAVVAEDVEAVVSRGAPIVEEPGEDPVTAVAAVIDGYLDVYLSLGRDLMREVVRASFGGSSDDLMPVLLDIDEHLLEQLGALIAHFKARGVIASDVPIDEAASLLFSIVVANLIIFISVEDLTGAEIHYQSRRQVALAFHGLWSSDRSDSNQQSRDPGRAPGDD